MAVSAREWMQEEEDPYRSLLKHAFLVVEADYTHRDAKRILDALGARLRIIKRVGGASGSLFKILAKVFRKQAVGAVAVQASRPSA